MLPNAPVASLSNEYADDRDGDINSDGDGAASGDFYVMPPGQSTPQLTHCDMDLEDGGWTQIAHARAGENVLWGSVYQGSPGDQN